MAPHRLIKFDLIARCAILLQAGMSCLIAWLVPTSLIARLIADGGVYGHNVLLLLTVTVVVGLLDVLINDLLPERMRLECTRRRRHGIFHILAGLFFVQAFVGVGDSIDIEDLLSLSYLLNGLIAAWYSWAISIRATHV